MTIEKISWPLILGKSYFVYSSFGKADRKTMNRSYRLFLGQEHMSFLPALVCVH